MGQLRDNTLPTQCCWNDPPSAMSPRLEGTSVMTQFLLLKNLNTSPDRNQGNAAHGLAPRQIPLLMKLLIIGKGTPNLLKPPPFLISRNRNVKSSASGTRCSHSDSPQLTVKCKKSSTWGITRFGTLFGGPETHTILY